MSREAAFGPIPGTLRSGEESLFFTASAKLAISIFERIERAAFGPIPGTLRRTEKISFSAELKNLYSLDNNVSALQKNVENYLGVSDKKDTPQKTETKQTQPKKSAGKKVIVKDLKINNTEVSVGFSGHTVAIPLPNIHKTGIGEEKKEKTIGEIIADILDLISVESVKAIATGAKDLAKQGLKDAKDLISSGTSSVKENAQNALDGIKGLFK